MFQNLYGGYSNIYHHLRRLVNVENLLKSGCSLLQGQLRIGRAAALKLAQRGGRVALVDLHKENVEDVKNQIEEMGSEALVL